MVRFWFASFRSVLTRRSELYESWSGQCRGPGEPFRTGAKEGPGPLGSIERLGPMGKRNTNQAGGGLVQEQQA